MLPESWLKVDYISFHCELEFSENFTDCPSGFQYVVGVANNRAESDTDFIKLILPQFFEFSEHST